MGLVLPWFWRGLGELGFTEGKNVRIEYRWADDENERLPALAAELVRRQVTVLFAVGIPAVMACSTASGDSGRVATLGAATLGD